MGNSESKTEYNINYAKEKLKRIPLDVQKEKYEEIKAAADKAGLPVNRYIKTAIDEKMKLDFTIVATMPECYKANKTKLFDAYHCLDASKTNSETISSMANAALNCFVRNAFEAFRCNQSFFIEQTLIPDADSLKEWILSRGSDDFHKEMITRIEQTAKEFNHTEQGCDN